MEARQPQFYKKVVPLSSEQHARLHIDARPVMNLPAMPTAVLLTTVEFSKASREYPIVFLEDGDKVNPVALLGLPGGREPVSQQRRKVGCCLYSCLCAPLPVYSRIRRGGK